MRSGLIVGVVLASMTSLAHADYDSEWRDGCPAGNLEKAADYITYSRAHSPNSSSDPWRPYSTDANASGTAPQPDSALIPTRILVLSHYDQFSGSPSTPTTASTDRARLLGVTLQGHVNIPVYGDENRLGVTATAASLDRFAGDSALPGMAPGQFGDPSIAIAFRHSWLSSYMQRARKQGDPITDPVGDIAALRHAWAVQLLWTRGEPTSDAASALILMRHSAFESYLFSPNRTYGGAIEYRSEGVGCYSPFFHLRLSGFETLDQSQHGMVILPETVALGLSVASNTTVFFQYGLLVAVGTQSENAEPVFGANVIHRFRFGGDWAFSHWSVGANFDEFRGSTSYDGFVFAVHLSLKPLSSGGWQ